MDAVGRWNYEWNCVAGRSGRGSASKLSVQAAEAGVDVVGEAAELFEARRRSSGFAFAFPPRPSARPPDRPPAPSDLAHDGLEHSGDDKPRSTTISAGSCSGAHHAGICSRDHGRRA